jgi:uncharacterized protein
MKFTWDEAKRRSNLVKHRLDFVDAPVVFAGIIFTFEDDRFDYEEQRFITLGILKGAVVVIAHTEQQTGDIRVISMRKATKHEQRLYFQGFTD